ncbi:MAG: S9 family peptidase [Bacteroidales bacterium]
MKKYILFLVLFFAVSIVGFAQKNDPTLLKRIVGGEFESKRIVDIRSMIDGEHFIRMSADSTAIVRYAYKTGKMVDTLFSVRKARDCGFKRIQGYDISPDETKILIYANKEQIFRHSFKADYFVYEVKRNIIYPLSKGGKQQMATFSPNSRMIVFGRNANLFLVKLDYGTESQMTNDGDPNRIVYGIPDWVYEEEFSFNRAFEWSPDNNFVAYIRFNQTKVPEYSYPVYKELKTGDVSATAPEIERVRYPRAGQPNSEVCVQTFNVLTKVVKTMELGDPEIEYIPRIRFTSQPDKLAVFTLNRQQNKFTIYTSSPRSGLSRLLIREESDTYINNDLFDQIAFYPDQIVYVSDRDGYRHIYDYSPIGVLRRQVTKGNWEVTNLLGYNPATGVYYFESNESSPLRNAVYSLDGKGRKICLTPSEGTNHGEFSNNYNYFINRFSNVKTPLITEIRDAAGKQLVALETNAELKKKIVATHLAEKDFFTFRTDKYISLNGWMIKPQNFDPLKSYPVVMVQYSGPNHQEVKDAFKVDWEQYLVQQGYVVVCVDGRGSGGRGAVFAKQTYQKLGLLEAEDQIQTARYLASLPYIDKNRIAIWGWSYGGYNVLMSMSLGKGVFKAGIAVAPVTDWRFYDSVYSERYMRTPKENIEGYELSSAGHYAADLQGSLLLVQGTADDNVHFQNTADYAEQLVQAGKPFDMEIYTNRNHFIKGGNTRLHLYERFVRFLDQNL